MSENREKVLQVKDLVISFKTDKGIVHAVRGVSFDLYKGETLCIVGESGSGKSVTNKAIMGISAKNARIEHGQILYEGEDLVRVSEEEFHRIRGHKIGMIFQDPLSALNPVMRIGKQITEATLTNKNILKRKYSELISKELIAYRNNKANTSYNILRLQNEIATNKKRVEDLKRLNTEIEKITLYINDLEKEPSSLKTLEKIKFLKNDLSEKKNQLNSIISDVQDYINRSKIDVEEDIIKFKDRVAKYSKVDENLSDLEKEILNNKCVVAKRHLEIVSLKDYCSFEGEIDADLINRNNYLLKSIDAYKFEYKICKPSLKKSLKISKKKAKKEIKEYATNLKNEHINNLKLIKKEIKENEDLLDSYKTSLRSEEVERIEEVVRRNESILKKQRKEAKKFKEINVSKTHKDDEEKIVEIPDQKYKELYDKISELKQKIVLENDEYINKTKITKSEAKKMALAVMKEVGIPMPEKRFKQYPFEFSGGMRQRIVIAIALTANPDILICDEPTTALDVTIQAQILELINRLKAERNLSCIFITHDLGVVANMADRVAVMYAGKIVEYGLANEVFFDPKHPYTWALLSSIPDIDSKEKLEAIPGTPPDMIYPPKGDAFALRSKYAMAVDFKYEPPFFKVTDTHYAATWLLYPGAPKVEMPKIVKTRIENALKEQQEFLKKEVESNGN